MDYEYHPANIYKSFFDLISTKEYDNGDNSGYPPNTNLDFLPMDTKELWDYNQKIQNDYKTINYYLDNPINYRLNNYGYRTNYDFKEGDEVNIFLGCSHTTGIGLHLENTWSHIVNEYIGGNFVNLSLGGSGIEKQFRHLVRWSKFFKIKNIFHYQPLYAREEFLYDESYLNFQLAGIPDEIQENVKDGWLEYTFGSEHHVVRKYLTNILAINSIANSLDSNYYFYNLLPPPTSKYKSSIKARDFAHFCVEHHVGISNVFIEKIKSNDISIPIL